MIKRNKLTMNLVLAVTILAALGGFWGPAAAKSGDRRLVAGETIELGRQGLYVSNIPAGVTHVDIDNIGTNLPSRLVYRLEAHYRAPAMEVRFLDANGDEVAKISALVYVYFDIARAERDSWLEGGMDKIAIWFANEQTGSWEACPTHFVHKSGGDGTVGRLSCLAPGSGYYILVQAGPGKSLPKATVDSNAVASSPGTATLKVRAYIDGRSQLIIQGNEVYWHHLDFAAPGRHYDAQASQPTYLNNVSWLPAWPDVPDPENRDCNCNSSTYRGVPRLAQAGQLVRIEVVQGRGNFIVQHPSAGNDYTLIVELDDNLLDGPAWYEFNLRYVVATSGL